MIANLTSHQNPFLKQILSLAEGVSVLYVEDEPVIREEMAETLSTLFPEVVTATNGKEGLALFQSREFLLVVTDINMPLMNGIELIREIRKLRPSQSVLVTSAYSDAANLIPLLNLGVGSFVLKPLSWEQLLPAFFKELSVALATQQEQRYQKRLEREVNLRTEELREAQTQLLRLSEAKDGMLALISHEMRTPLNAILGFLELVRPSLAHDPDALVFLGYVDQAANRLDRSTKKALEFSHFSTGKKSLSLMEIHLEVLVQSVWDQVLTSLAPESRPQLTATGVKEKLLYSDSEMVAEVLRNLFENGIKYGVPNPVLEVSLAIKGIWAELTVRDHGPGFSEHSLAQLFVPFTSGNIMHHSEGMGLGLALVEVIMMTLGGKASGGNHQEGGAWITLSFPVQREPSLRATQS